MPIEGVTTGGATPGMPMMPGTSGAPTSKPDSEISDASGLLRPQEFPALDSNGMPIEGVSTGGAMPMMPSTGGAPTSKLDSEVSDASGLIKPQVFTALDSNGMPIEGVSETGGAMPGMPGGAPIAPREFTALDSNGMPVEGVTSGGAMPGMPMMPGSTPATSRDEVSDASGLIRPQEFAALASNGLPVEGVTTSGATPGTPFAGAVGSAMARAPIQGATPGGVMPMMPGVTPATARDEVSEASGLIKPQESAALDGIAATPGAASAEPGGAAGAQVAHRVPVVRHDGGVDETAAWGVAGAALLFAAGRGRRDDPEVRIDAISTERESTWTGEPERATWQPNRSATGQGASVEEVPLFCGVGAGPEPVAAEPEEEPVEESEKDTEATAVSHLLAQEATMWGGPAGSGVLE
jgi:hypothetical protein